MKEEMQALAENETWDLVTSQKESSQSEANSMYKYKAQLAAKR